MSLSARASRDAGRPASAVRGTRTGVAVARHRGAERHARPARSGAGLRDPGFDTDMPLAGRLDVGPRSGSALSRGTRRRELGSGFFKLNDPDHEPVMMSQVVSAIRFDPSSRSASSLSPETIKTEHDRTMRSRRSFASAAPGASDGRLTADGVGVVRPRTPERERPFARRDHGGRAPRLRCQVSHDREAAIAWSRGHSRPEGSVRIAETVPRTPRAATAGRMPAPVILRLWPRLSPPRFGRGFSPICRAVRSRGAPRLRTSIRPTSPR